MHCWSPRAVNLGQWRLGNPIIVGYGTPIVGSRSYSSSGQRFAVPVRPVRASVDGSRVLVPSGSSQLDDRAGQCSDDALNGLDRGHDQLPEGVDVFDLNEHHDVVGSGDCLGGDHAGHAADGSGDVGCSAGVGLDQDVRSKNRCLLILGGQCTGERGSDNSEAAWHGMTGNQWESDLAIYEPGEDAVPQEPKPPQSKRSRRGVQIRIDTNDPTGSTRSEKLISLLHLQWGSTPPREFKGPPTMIEGHPPLIKGLKGAE